MSSRPKIRWCTLESDKATMDIPAPFCGMVKAVRIKVGDKVAEGNLILTMEVSAGASRSSLQKNRRLQAAAPVAPAAPIAETKPAPRWQARRRFRPWSPAANVHASPSVRAFARELGVDLTQVNGSGPKRRILREDVQAYVKAELSKPRGAAQRAG